MQRIDRGLQFASEALRLKLFLANVNRDEAAQAAFSCPKECSPDDNVNGLCHVFSQGLSNEIDGMEQLTAALLQPGPATIAKTDLMGWFQQQADPCDRSDTTLSEAGLTNTGRAYRLRSEVTGPLAMSLSVTFPDLLSAGLTRDGDSGTLQFTNAATRPSVTLSDPLLDADFGGDVLAFDFARTEAYLTTQNGCLAYLWE